VYVACFCCNVAAYRRGSEDKADYGVIPRTCICLFDSIAAFEAARVSGSIPATTTSAAANDILYDQDAITGGVDTRCRVDATYYEIYNEKVMDLLASPLPSSPTKGDRSLKVREHPTKGPFVDGAVVREVKSWSDMAQVLASGNKMRSTAATNMNSRSSRSHAVLQLTFTQTAIHCAKKEGSDSEVMTAIDRLSTCTLVDLAGSERADKTGNKASACLHSSIALSVYYVKIVPLHHITYLHIHVCVIPLKLCSHRIP
jgi:Kinesin motor domain